MHTYRFGALDANAVEDVKADPPGHRARRHPRRRISHCRRPERQTNRLTHLAEMRQLRVTLAEYLGTRAGLEYVALLNAMAVWGGVVI